MDWRTIKLYKISEGTYLCTYINEFTFNDLENVKFVKELKQTRNSNVFNGYDQSNSTKTCYILMHTSIMVVLLEIW